MPEGGAWRLVRRLAGLVAKVVGIVVAIALLTQRGVSAFARSCWYDRADLGWSDSGPDPAWGDAAARDLHRLVQNAGLKPPFVLVGHSFGGASCG